MTLTKAELVNKLYHTLNVTRQQACDIVETFLKISKSTLLSGEDLLISGFGKFHVKTKKERRGRNPSTGKAMTLDARKVVTFKPAGKLNDRVKGGR
jgi:integration host factor subunit alpha